MLTSSRKGMTAKQTIDYYTSGLAKEDYYFMDTEVSYWSGKGASMLGLEGEVDKQDFINLANNKHPETGQKLKPRQSQKMIAANDLTFSVPKDVSMAMTFTKDAEVKQELMDIVMDASKHTNTYIESLMQTRKHRGLKTRDEYTNNAVISNYLQSTSRPVDGIPMPQWHIHTLLHNLTYVEDKERFHAAQVADIYKKRPIIEDYFHNELAKGLTDKGYAITREHGKARLVGISREGIESFSTRTKQIEDYCKANDITDPKIKGELGAKLRQNKKDALPFDQVEAYWNQLLSDDDRDAIDNLKRDASEIPHISSEQALDFALEHHLENESRVTEKHLLRTAMRHGVGTVDLHEIKAGYQEKGVLLFYGDRGIEATTRDIHQREQETNKIVREGRFSKWEHTEYSYDMPEFFSKKQRKGLLRLANSTNLVDSVKGLAGAGKTTVLRTFDDWLAKEDKKLLATAPTHSATNNLKQDGFRDTATLAKLLHSKELQEQFSNEVVLLDEAGMVGEEDMHKLMVMVKENNMRLVMVGDDKQHSAVARGEPFRLINKYAGLKVIELDEIRRQKTERYRAAVAWLSKGEVVHGFKQLDKMGVIKEIGDEERYKVLANDYVDAVNRGESALVVSPTHAEKDLVTDEVRNALKEEGKIGKEEKTINVHRQTHLSTAQKKNARFYEVGQRLQLNQNVRGFTKGDKLTVVGFGSDALIVENADGKIGDVKLNQAKRFNLYEHQEKGFAQGDVIRITQGGNSTLKGQNTRYNTNDRYTIKGFTKDGDMKLEGGRILSKEFGNIDHGIVTTSHSSQGQTVDNVFIANSSTSFGQATNLKQFYVSASRGKYTATVYTDDKQELLNQVQKTAERQTATELLEKGNDSWGDKVREQFKRAQDFIDDQQRRMSNDHNREVGYGR